MATFYTDEENDKQNEQAVQPLTQTTAAPAPTGGQGATLAQGTSPSASQRKPTASGSFVDIGKYYEAGKDNAQKVQQQIAGNLERQATQAKQRFTKGVQDYSKNLQQNQLDAGVFSGRDVRNIDEGQFRNLFQDKAIQQYQDAGGMQAYRQAGRNIGGTGTEAGRIQALRSLADKGYSSGESKLDSFLLNRAERDKSVLGDLRNRYTAGNIESQIGQAMSQAAQARQGVMRQREDVRQRARDFLRSQGQGLRAVAGTSDAAATDRARAQYRDELQKAWQADLYDKLSSGGPGARVSGPKNFEDVLAALANQGFGESRITAGSGIDPGQVERYNRLASIAGVGEPINVLQSQGIDRAAALAALRGLTRVEASEKAPAVAKKPPKKPKRTLTTAGYRDGPGELTPLMDSLPTDYTSRR